MLWLFRTFDAVLKSVYNFFRLILWEELMKGGCFKNLQISSTHECEFQKTFLFSIFFIWYISKSICILSYGYIANFQLTHSHFLRRKTENKHIRNMKAPLEEEVFISSSIGIPPQNRSILPKRKLATLLITHLLSTIPWENQPTLLWAFFKTICNNNEDNNRLFRWFTSNYVVQANCYHTQPGFVD